MPNQLAIVIGSTDWAGGTAPASGTHTGLATITMADATTYVVAHNRAEVLRKLDGHATAPASTALAPWVAFDAPQTAVPLILNVANIAGVV